MNNVSYICNAIINLKDYKIMYIYNKKFTPNFKIFCREIYNSHPQGKGIYKFNFWMEKYKEELLEGFEMLTI